MQRNKKSKKKQPINDRWEDEMPIKKKKNKHRSSTKVKYKHKWLEMEEELWFNLLQGFFTFWTQKFGNLARGSIFAIFLVTSFVS